VANSLADQGPSGQVVGQINRLKALKLAMFGRAGVELLRACVLPIAAHGYTILEAELNGG
jgi:transposase